MLTRSAKKSTQQTTPSSNPVKKRRQAKKITGNWHRNGLTFGAQKRELPDVLFSFCFGFLELNDFAALFFASKTLSASVAAMLEKTKSLFCNVQGLRVRADTAIERCSFALAAKHCAQLQTIHCECDDQKIKGDVNETLQKWLVAIVQKNPR